MKEERNNLEENLKKLAILSVSNSETAEMIGVLTYEISKERKKKMSKKDFWSIENWDESDDLIPIEIIRFLKKRRNTYKFICEIRDEICRKLYSSEKVSSIDIINFSIYFQKKDAKEFLKVNNENLIKMALFLCTQEIEGYGELVSSMRSDGEMKPEVLDRMYYFFSRCCMTTDNYPEDENEVYLKGFLNALRFFEDLRRKS